MACYHPLLALNIGKLPNGKQNIEFLHHPVADEDQIVLSSDGRPFPRKNLLRIPCGQCIGCRIERSRQWANRCMMELESHESSFFVTLTYDELHVPTHYYSDPATGEAYSSLSLDYSDFQKFMKRLRKNTGQELRYFMSGEYGSTTFRPHYHAIIFGLTLDDLKLYRRSEQGHVYYNSPTISKAWSDKDGYQIGHAVVADVTWETCAYTARYILKKLTGEQSAFYDLHNIEPEFCHMSTKPGIAHDYYVNHPEIYESDIINLRLPKGGRQVHPPRYFDKLYDLEDPDALEAVKANRRLAAENAQRLKLMNTDLSYDELLQVEEDSFKHKTKVLFERSKV